MASGQVWARAGDHVIRRISTPENRRRPRERSARAKMPADTYRYAETCPEQRATAQGRIRIDITANVRAVLLSFVLSRPLLYLVWNTLIRPKIKCTCALHAWYSLALSLSLRHDRLLRGITRGGGGGVYPRTFG